MRRTDTFLLLLVILLTVFGLLVIYDASSYIAFRDFGDKYHYTKGQFIWMILGFSALGFFSWFDYHKLQKVAFPILVSAFLLLLAVFIPGIGSGPVLGAHRWINLHVFVLQPAEFIKLALAIYLAAWFAKKEKKQLRLFFLLLGMILILILKEPDMGTGIIVMFESLAIYYLAGGNTFYLVVASPVVAVVGLVLAKLEPYRAARLTAFLDPLHSQSSSAYHVKQILIALGSGGITGVGFGNSLQKYAYLPENVTDSIFAIIAEELGFLGATALIIVFALFVWRGMLLAASAKDNFGKYLAGGLVTFLGVQAFLNLGSETALLPLTGVPLPFISYGGSSLVIDLASVGILLNIGKQAHLLKKR